MSFGVPGLGLTYEAIDVDTEARLLAAIDAAPWSNELRRRVQHYGWRYRYKGRGVSERLGALPPWAAQLAERLVNEGRFLRAPDQVIVNEYEPGQGIAEHTDSPVFGAVVASLSLGSGVTMTFSKEARIHLPRRSLLTLSGAARRDWKHGIPARKRDGGIARERRVSITFRTLHELDHAHELAPPSVAEHALFLDRRIALLDPALRASLRTLAVPEGVDLVQLELFEDREAESFPIEVLCKRKSDGEDHYSAGQSQIPFRSAAKLLPLVSEPLADAALNRYVDPSGYDEVIAACDLHRYERVCEWIVRAWDEEIGADFPVPAYFMRMGDDVSDEGVWDLRRRRRAPWEEMYDEETVG